MQEAHDLLDRGRDALATARDLLPAHPASAAREAYTAALFAARAVIFERTQKAPKTHSGAHTLFHELIAGGLPFPLELAAFLKTGFELKVDADYGSRRRADMAAATAAVRTAADFVAAAAAVLPRQTT